MEVVQSGLSDCGGPGVAGELPERGEVIIGSVVHVAGMNAHAGEDLCEAFRDCKIGGDVFEVGSEGDEAGDPCFASSGEQSGQLVGREFVRAEMAMAVREHGGESRRADGGRRDLEFLGEEPDEGERGHGFSGFGEELDFDQVESAGSPDRGGDGIAE
jgi:hypothetical protein